jgi:hypothetical protein
MVLEKYAIWILSQMRRAYISFILIVITIGSGWAQAPVMEEQMVYGLQLFNGKGYAGSFCSKSEDTIYIITGSENVLSPKMTLVYYWPITRKLQAGFKTLNEKVEGTLEILQNGKVIRNLKRRTYTFYFAKGWYAETSEIILNDKAKEKYGEYTQAMDRYYKLTKQYHDKQRDYQKQMEEFFAKIKERQKSGMTPEQYGPIPVPKEPAPPAPPKFHVQEPREEYIVNLPAGRYEIRLHASDGTIFEGSEKKVVSFTYRRSGKIGYEIIPAKRWTMPETSSDPAEIIYLEGKNTLYFRPYIQTEYNHLYYSKLLDPQNEGHSELWRWINIKQIEKGALHLIKNGKVVSRIQEEPYSVHQVPGQELGYTIAGYDKEKLPGRGPSLVGYKVEFEPGKGGQQIQLVDASGKVFPGSLRELRAVDVGEPRELYITAVVLPLVVAAPIFLWRRRKLK